MADELWRDPKAGDVLTMRDGRKRMVTYASAEFGVLTYRTPARYRTECLYPTWITTARREGAKGGSYERPAKGAAT